MVCNKDCFNCIYEDCINDTFTHEDYKQFKNIDRIITGKPQVERCGKDRRYYQKHYEDIKAKRQAKAKENRERTAEWQRENMGRCVAKNKAYRERKRVKEEVCEQI